MPKEITNELILEEIRRNRQELKATIEAVEVRILMKIEEQNQRINEIENKYIELAEKIEDIQKKEKQNNVIIFGLQKTPEEINIDFITTEIKKLVNIEIKETDINNYYTLGKQKNCPLKLELVSYLKKSSILRNVKHLKGTNISIVNDLTIRQREENKILRKHLLIAKQNKNNTCYIRNNKLHINNNIYSAQDLEQLENTHDENLQSQPRSAPETPTTFSARNFLQLTTGEQQTVQGPWRNRTKTSSNTPEGSAKEKKEAKETTKRIGKDTAEDKVTTRSKK